jgi:uncharacterized protein (TIGR03118 family)
MILRNFRLRASNVAIAIAMLTPGAVFAQTAGKNSYVQHNLVSDLPGTADVTDPNLVNPWGISETATSPFWISDHDTGLSTLYNGAGAITAVVVKIPPGTASSSTIGTPTGQVAGNGVNWILPSPNGKVSSFIFATEDGTISAWNGSIAAPATAIKMVDNSAAGAVYKGLASVGTGTPLLFAANFASGKIDVFDGNFAPTTVAGGFADPGIPAGFGPFNIQNIGGKLYVAYAKQGPGGKFDISGAGNGYVDVFDLTGTLIQRIASQGPLNSPWGVAIAPASWGAFGGALLVGNFGDGKINAFDLTKGTALGTLQDASGNPIVNVGLWALQFGNGGNGGDPSVCYIAAGISGPDNKTHGLLAGITPPQGVANITNAASQVIATAIAPGEIVELNGFTLGPSPRVANALPTSGLLGTTVTGTTAASGPTSVTFNGTPAPIFYASAGATSVIVPYEVSGSATASVVVTYKGNISPAFSIPVAPTAPGLFTVNQTGSGAVIAINFDGTLNSATNATPRGFPILLYATGEGQTDPTGLNGAITGQFIRTPFAPVSLTIAGLPATVVYAGSAVGSVAGLMEVEAVVPTLPAGVGAGTTGPVPIVLTVGSASSQTTATLFVR